MNIFKLVALITVLALQGCERQLNREVTKLENICNGSSVEQRADFALTCIANANPKSDEEPEDWIRLCYQMAMETYCPAKTVIATQEKRCSSCPWETMTRRVISGD